MTAPESTEARTTTGDDRESFFDDVPWQQALVIGIGAFVVGFVLLSGLVVAEGVLDDSVTDETGEVDSQGDEPGLLTVLGWVYFGAHFVDLGVDTVFGSMSFDMFGALMEEAVIPEILWRLVPVVVLIGAGYLLAARVLPATASPEDGAKIGATVTVGYLLTVAIGTQVFEFTGDEGTSASVEFTEALLLAGLLYPILLGAFGGYLAVRRGATETNAGQFGPRA
ncbi:hypothetical protein Halru_0144 [Halovivax ruber XH-70]|uniref:DUF7978 domain-containing protein n=1 Tax=Halovivax ruber (strain DSM 18193 / JCM 13892 / XH-70) TaxID=797302 RepID=L0I9A5_HALRX|nr:hypothetical protein [Halovivax ruber]AGB14796.1 hypothetical protein Halru_0144 [Halovivax ruber XH-70]